MQGVQHATSRKCVCDHAIIYHASVADEQMQLRIATCINRIVEWCNTKDHTSKAALVNLLYIGINGIDPSIVNDWVSILEAKGYKTEQANGTLIVSF
jgi:hypothetical protein